LFSTAAGVWVHFNVKLASEKPDKRQAFASALPEKIKERRREGTKQASGIRRRRFGVDHPRGRKRRK
jgi:hypothetical protein